MFYNNAIDRGSGYNYGWFEFGLVSEKESNDFIISRRVNLDGDTLTNFQLNIDVSGLIGSYYIKLLAVRTYCTMGDFSIQFGINSWIKGI